MHPPQEAEEKIKTAMPSMPSASSKQLYELNPEHVKLAKQFQEQFNDFFGQTEQSSKETKSHSTGIDQSGSVVFQYNEEDEYLDNLLSSGNFKSTREFQASFRDRRPVMKLTDFGDSLGKADELDKLVLERRLTEEVHQCDQFENIFELKASDEFEDAKDLSFFDLTFERMHVRKRKPKPSKHAVSTKQATLSSRHEQKLHLTLASTVRKN